MFWNHIHGRLSILIPLTIFGIATVMKTPVAEILYKAKSHSSRYCTTSFTCLIISISGSISLKSSSSKTAIGERLGMCLLESMHNQSCNRVNLPPVQHAIHFRYPEWCHMLSIFLVTTATSLENKAPHLLEVWEGHRSWIASLQH